MLATPGFVERAVMLVNEVKDIEEEQTRFRWAKLICILSKTRQGVERLGKWIALMACDQLSSIQSDALFILENTIADSDPHLHRTILACPYFFERITAYLSWTNDEQQKMCIKAVQIVRQLLWSGTAKLMSTVRGMAACRDRLLELLASVLQGNIQVKAIWALRDVVAAGGILTHQMVYQMVYQMESEIESQMESRMELCNDEVFEAVLKYVFKDVGEWICVAAIQITSRLRWGEKILYTGMGRLLNKLTTLLTHDVDGSVQEAALEALGAFYGDGIALRTLPLMELCNDEVYEAVLEYVSKDVCQRLCVRAMRIITWLPGAEKNMHRCLDKLTPLLPHDHDVDRSVQEGALETLRGLLKHRYTYGDKRAEVRIALRMLESPVLLETIGMHFCTHLSDFEESHIHPKGIIDRVVHNCRRSDLRRPEELEIVADCLKLDRFTQILTRDVHEMIRDAALSALVYLVDDASYGEIPLKNRISVLATEGLLKRLGSLVSEDRRAALIIEQLVKLPRNKGVLLQCRNTIHNLQTHARILEDDEGLQARIPEDDEDDHHHHVTKEDEERRMGKTEWIVWMTKDEIAQHLLAALYFDDELRIYLHDCTGTRLWYTWRILQPIIRLLLVLHVHDKCNSSSYSSARQVFLNFMKHRQFHEEGASNLLDSCHYALPMVQALLNLVNQDFCPASGDAEDANFGYVFKDSEDTEDTEDTEDAEPSKGANNDTARTRFNWTPENSCVGRRMMSSLVRLLENSSKLDTEGRQILGFCLFFKVTDAVSLLLRKVTDDNRVKLLEAGILTKAVPQMAKILANAHLSQDSKMQMQVVTAIADLAYSSEIVELEVAKIGGLPECLIMAVFQDDNRILEARAFKAVGKLVADIDSFRSKLVDVSITLEGLVKTLTTQDAFDRRYFQAAILLKDLSKNQHAALKIVSRPGALEGLLIGLHNGETLLRDTCVEAFANLAAWGSSIPSEWNNFPSLVEGLVTPFFQLDNHDVKSKALLALSDLAATNNSFRLQLEVRVKAFFQNGNCYDQSRALNRFNVLVGDDRLRLKLITVPGIGEGLVRALGGALGGPALGGSLPLSIFAAKLLTRLVEGGHHIKSELCNWPGLLEKLVDVVVMGQDGNDFNPICALTHLNPQRGKEMQLRSAMAYTGRGQAEAELGLYHDALEDLDVACLLGPPIWYTLSIRCYVKVKLSDFQGAIVDANSACGIRPTWFTFLERGVLKCMMDDLPGALADLKRSSELCPNVTRSKYTISKHKRNVESLMRGEDGSHADEESVVACDLFKLDDLSGISFLSGTRPLRTVLQSSEEALEHI